VILDGVSERQTQVEDLRSTGRVVGRTNEEDREGRDTRLSSKASLRDPVYVPPGAVAGIQNEFRQGWHCARPYSADVKGAGRPPDRHQMSVSLAS
jgi:hypothetical protein